MSQKLKVLILNGPNLGRLGLRQPEIYGHETLEETLSQLAVSADALSVETEARQSNHEGDLLDWIGTAADEGFSGILLNAGAYTHTSVALHDAISGTDLPVVEVHISNPDAREDFRKKSHIAAVCVARVAGFGRDSYRVALEGLVQLLRKNP